MKRLTTHLKFKNYALGVRVFVAWANHMRALENFKAMEFMRHEKEKFETADKEAKKGAKGQEAASAAMKGAQEEGKVCTPCYSLVMKLQSSAMHHNLTSAAGI